MGSLPGVLVVRRSIHIQASPERVWQEFGSFERMNGWWGAQIGTPEAGTGNGQRLVRYELRPGARVEMEVTLEGKAARYGGPVLVAEAARELTFESDWIPTPGWVRRTAVTIRLTPALDGTLVELLHHGFERTGPGAREDHAAYEAGWGMTQLIALRRVVTG